MSQTNKIVRKCLYCGELVQGRIDKKFCSVYCKSAYHYEQSATKDPEIFQIVNKQLRINRRILKTYNKSGKSYVYAKDLFKEGFNPRIFTHYWKAKNKNIYLFCFEYGFLKSKDKYLLITWQSYMHID